MFVVLALLGMNVGVSSFCFAEDSAKIFLKSETIDTSDQKASFHLTANHTSTKTVYLIVQFDGTFSPKYKDDLMKLGATFLHYLPDNAYLIRLQERTTILLPQLKYIRWFGDYKAQYKIDPVLLKVDAQSESEAIHLNIKLFTGESFDKIKQWIVSHQGEVTYAKEGYLRAKLSRKHLPKLAGFSAVEWIEKASQPELLNLNLLKDEEDDDKDPKEPEEPVGRYEDLKGYETGVKILGVDAAYADGLSGTNQIVGMADTGVDTGNDKTKDLSQDFVGAIVRGYALGFFSKSWADPNGHGTHVAGSILGRGTYSEKLLHGVANDSKLVVQGLMGMFGSLDVPSDLADLLYPPYQDGARVHSNSWGNPSSQGYDQYAKTVDEYIWKNPDMLVVFAAGNSGEDQDKDGVIDEGSLLSPAVAKNVLTVGASENYVLEGGIQREWGKLRNGDQKWGTEPIASDTPSDNENGIAAFSSRGPTEDGRIKPDIVAPGTNILSARSHHEEATPLWGAFNEHYAWSGGTSMATPLVSGTASLIRQFYVEKMGLEYVSAALVKATLINGAIDMYPGQFGFGKTQELSTRRPNMHEGWGRVNVDHTFYDENRALRFVDHQEGIRHGMTDQYKIKVLDSKQPFSVTLVYTDYPAASAAQKVLVNDLDLTVTHDQGQNFYPNGLKTADRKNNVEGVDILEPTLGEYTVSIHGKNIPQGNAKNAQPYALVVSGSID
ncbi:MAG: hypothetical protein A3B70_01240 [Deltaproteobacteria bacterium RIFCSPHIGHO2_02_FULL_40_11]|nr:MAG: hypothetical protein A3B70_01240 [Deltaproteobacteria bacterium RIFCSPHIGHO2_02_FULL_40_11]